jgi:hypothetical protein
VKQKEKTKTYLFSGNTLVPKDFPMRDQIQRTIAMLEIDPEKEIIVKASFMTLIPHTNEFLASIADGYDLKQGIEPLLEELVERAHVPPVRAWTKAIEIAYQKYIDFRKKRYA